MQSPTQPLAPPRKASAGPHGLEGRHVRQLAWFRYSLRRFLRFSERAARACGVTPQQHQLMLGVAGFVEDRPVTISDLAEFLQERNNSVVGLVQRAAQSGLVRRASGTDRRQVVVTLTPRGRRVLARLSALHQREVGRLRVLMDISGTPGPVPPRKPVPPNAGRRPSGTRARNSREAN
jgi:DNA-binding MarR family transcriptional regulator